MATKLIDAEAMMLLLGVSAPTFFRMKKEGMPDIRITERLVRYDPEDVFKWLKGKDADKKDQG